MYTKLPLYPESVFSYSINLAGTTFKFEFEWNKRTNSFYFNILDESNTPLYQGLKLIPGAYPVQLADNTYLTCLAALPSSLNGEASMEQSPDAYRLVFFEA